MESVQSPYKTSSKTLDPQGVVCDMCWGNAFGTEEFFALCVAVNSQARHNDESVIIRYRMQIGKMRADCQWCNYVTSLPYLWPRGVPQPESHPDDQVEVEMSNSHGLNSTRWATQSNDGCLGLKLSPIKFNPDSGGFVKYSYHGTPNRLRKSMISADENDAAADYVRFRPLQTFVDVASTTFQIRPWLEDCNSVDHWGCGRIESAVLPTRVIDVSPVKDPARPRLLLTRGKKDRYAALSYAWGTRPHDCSLLTSSVDKWTGGFELAVLPQTFQDAIQVTRAASIPYLWIDALCIVQDDAEDKRREISTMLNTYGQSTVTIVAGSASSAYEGFLHRRSHPSPLSEISRAKVPLRVSHEKFGSVLIYSEYGDFWNRNLEPINKRAWTMQEQLLARRYLSYESQSLRYRCLTGSWNTRSSPREFRDDFIEKYGLQTVQPESTLRALRHWLALLENYTTRNLSQSEDKLLAIAGIAEKFTPFLGPSYYAGIWEKYICEQICWKSQGLHRMRSSPYRAPSWSWASVDGEIRSAGDLSQHDQKDETVVSSWHGTRFIGCHVRPLFEASRPGQTDVQVAGGWLRLECILVRAWLLPSIDLLLWSEKNDGSLAAAEQAYHERMKQADAGKGQKALGKSFFQRFGYDSSAKEEAENWHPLHENEQQAGYWDVSEDVPPCVVWCLQLVEISLDLDRRESTGSHSISGILLLTNQDGTYRRVGSFSHAEKIAFVNGKATEIVII